MGLQQLIGRSCLVRVRLQPGLLGLKVVLQLFWLLRQQASSPAMSGQPRLLNLLSCAPLAMVLMMGAGGACWRCSGGQRSSGRAGCSWHPCGPVCRGATDTTAYTGAPQRL
jgi:hypothetical protein